MLGWSKCLVGISVAERYPTNRDATQGIQDISNLDVRSDTPHIDNRVEAQGSVVVVHTVDARRAGGVSILPLQAVSIILENA